MVVVAAKATVAQRGLDPRAGARNYRLTVTVQNAGGHWLVSGLRFVV